MDLNEFVKNNPKKKRCATEKQREFAEKIAMRLDIEEPDYGDFDETAEFISMNVEDYGQVQRDERSWANGGR